jgi:hypothetical protein
MQSVRIDLTAMSQQCCLIHHTEEEAPPLPYRPGRDRQDYVSQIMNVDGRSPTFEHALGLNSFRSNAWTRGTDPFIWKRNWVGRHALRSRSVSVQRRLPR